MLDRAYLLIVMPVVDGFAPNPYNTVNSFILLFADSGIGADLWSVGLAYEMPNLTMCTWL